MDILDRAAYELDAHKSPERIEGAELPEPVDAHVHRDELRAVDFDARPAAEEARRSRRSVSTSIRCARLRFPERVRLTLSCWQSIGAIIVVLGIAVGASGVGAYGLVVAHDWGCRIGLIKSDCPAPTPPSGNRRGPIFRPEAHFCRSQLSTAGRGRGGARFDFDWPAGKHGAR